MKFVFGTRGRQVREMCQVDTSHALVRYPNDLAPRRVEGVDLVLEPARRRTGFQPNVVLTSTESTAPLADASASAIADTLARHPGSRLIAVDGWQYDTAAKIPRARQLTLTYPAATIDVVVTMTVWATGRHHVHLTASYAADDTRSVEPVFRWIARELRVKAAPDAVERAARTVGAAALDSRLSQKVSFPLEDLTPFAPAPFVSQGLRISVGTLDALRAGAARARIASPYGLLPQHTRESLVAAETRAAGFTDESGKLTATGHAVAASLQSERQVLLARSSDTRRNAILLAYAGPGVVCVLHDPALSEPVDHATEPDAPLRHVLVVHPSRLPALTASWLGMRPTLPVYDSKKRTIKASALRSGARDAPVGTWTESWRSVYVRTSVGDLVDVVEPDGRWYRPEPPVAGVQELIPDTDSAVYAHLLASVSFPPDRG